MADHCEECSNDITLENLTCFVQIYWGCTYLCRFSREGTSFEVGSLAFGIHALRVLLKCVTIRYFTPATRKRFIIFIMTFAYFNLKTRIIQSSFHCRN